MRLSLLHTLIIACLVALSTAGPQDHSLRRRKRNWNVYSNNTVLDKTSKAIPSEDLSELEKRSGTKYVFMHHIVGNTYPYTYADWLDDMAKIAAKGVDAIALNIGGSDWQRTQLDSAYAAAQASGTGIKLFYSFDLTEMDCNLSDLVARVNRFASHPAQFKVNGKVLISSFSGDCLGSAGWASLKLQTNAYLMPFVLGLEGIFNQWSELDSWYCWGCAWPQGDYPKNTDDDNYYMNQLGTRYATTISPWMYTHLSYKNFYLRGDDWLIVSRWEQLMEMRDRLTFVELATWNDYGESHYLGPIKGAQPSGTTWANNYPHTAWYDLSEYYITAFKTGVYPRIMKDVIYFWARPHPSGANASGDSIGKPSGWNWTEDSMWAVVFATDAGTVVLKCGSSTKTFQVNAGVNKLKIPLSPGKMTVQMTRNNQKIIDYTPSDYTYITNPILYNYNAWVGSATASALASTSTSVSVTSKIPSSTTTSTSASASIATAPGWSYQGCYKDDNVRILSNGPFTDSAQTIAKCLARCQGGSFGYAGVEYGVECFCSNSLKAGTITAPESECNMPCAGKGDEKCGDSYRINIYKVGGTTSTSSSSSSSSASTSTVSITTITNNPTSVTTISTSTTSIVPGPISTAWSNYGCVAEGTSDSRRALITAGYSQVNMTPQVCQNLCSGYAYAGVEYGVQCYCGNSLTNNGATGDVILSSNCQSSCAGDASQKCGGSWTMNVYMKVVSITWSSVGCYVDSSSRMLRGLSTTMAGMTTEKCITSCSNAGFSLAATQNGRECYCSNQLYKENGAGNLAPSSQCNVPCEGNTAHKCGGSWRGNLYVKPGTVL